MLSDFLWYGVAWSGTGSVYSETRGLSLVSGKKFDFGLEKSLTLVW